MTRRGRGGFTKGMDEKKIPFSYHFILVNLLAHFKTKFGSLGLSSLNNCSLSLCTGHWTEQKEHVQEAVQEVCTGTGTGTEGGAGGRQFGTFSQSKFKKSLGRCP